MYLRMDNRYCMVHMIQEIGEDTGEKDGDRRMQRKKRGGKDTWGERDTVHNRSTEGDREYS